LKNKLPGFTYTLSDHGFHGHEGTDFFEVLMALCALPGFSQSVIAYVSAQDKQKGLSIRELCTEHSHYRIGVENINRTLKLWGALRGRSDARMHSDKKKWLWNTQLFQIRESDLEST
jgi:hypothetical protein